MRTVGILVDFDNFFPRPISQYNVSDIQMTLSSVVNILKIKIPDVDRFVVRLYGGWYENNSFTARASIISSMLPALNGIFPVLIPPKKIIQGNIELATQLYGHTFVWYKTYREHAGLPKLRIDHSTLGTQCQNNDAACPVRILKKFTEKKMKVCEVEGCTTVHSSVFFQRTQKYVDTMIACDIISFSSNDETVGLYVMSDDVDHFPAFAVSHDLNATKAKLGLFITNDQNQGPYSSLLAPFDIDVTLIH